MLKSKTPFLVIGDDWKLDAFRALFPQLNDVIYLRLTPKLRGFQFPIFVGNGEIYGRAKQIFGESITRQLWELSSKNFNLVKSSFADIEESKLIRILSNEREVAQVKNSGSFTKLIDVHQAQEPVLFWSLPTNQSETIKASKAQVLAETPTETCIGWSDGGVEGKVRANVILVLSSEWGIKNFPWLQDKLIPVTLSQFHSSDELDSQSVRLFNTGADFCYSRNSGTVFGSFRSLFSDKAVGFHREVRPEVRDGVEHFFSEKGILEHGLDDGQNFAATMTCDGLPLAGSIPTSPSVYFCGGFSARTSNFVFATLQALFEGITGKSDFSSISVLSTRRFL